MTQPGNDEKSSTELPITLYRTFMPFNKHGAPVVGNFGSRVDTVLIITTKEWDRLLEQHPSLKTAQFRVGVAD